MTLKEKFHQWLRTEPFNLRDRVTLREAQCEVIADEFAIGFAEWLLIIYNEDIIYDAYTKEELLEIYKIENEL
jgi:hypothetical protein